MTLTPLSVLSRASPLTSMWNKSFSGDCARLSEE